MSFVNYSSIHAIARSLFGVKSSHLLVYCCSLERMGWILLASWAEAPVARPHATVPRNEVPGNSLPSFGVRGGLAFLATWRFVLHCRVALAPRVLFLHSLSEQAFSTSYVPGSVLNAGKPKTEVWAMWAQSNTGEKNWYTIWSMPLYSAIWAPWDKYLTQLEKLGKISKCEV